MYRVEILCSYPASCFVNLFSLWFAGTEKYLAYACNVIDAMNQIMNINKNKIVKNSHTMNLNLHFLGSCISLSLYFQEDVLISNHLEIW